ncbi:MAG: FecR domain-containing protein [Bacteroidota bacterium]
MEKSNIHNEQDDFLAQWLAGNLSDEDLKNRVGTEDFLLYKKLQKGTNVLGDLEQMDTTHTFSHIQRKIQARSTRKIGIKRTLRWALPIAASFLLVFAGYKFFGNDQLKTETSYAEQKELTLLDGSRVVLNAKSALDYNNRNWELKREVRLKGEAFFKVEKGSRFSVITENGTVAVLGTSFSVNAADDYFEVMCYEGRVEVLFAEDSTVLGPNMTLRKTKGRVDENSVALGESPDWLRGESSFKSVPLLYVIDALERQYHLEFDTTKIDESALFTGSFGHENVKVALAAVFKTMRIQYSRENGNVLVLSPYE